MKNVQVQRIFYPVGHGAFYVEVFHDCDSKGKFFTFVYDCGSSNKNIIKGCIDKAFTQGDFINALFIAHFDEDHVNGLEYLKDYMTHQTKVFIPFYYKNPILLCPTRIIN